MYKEKAEAAQRAAELAQANAETFAGMVASVKMIMDDATDEMTMLADAKTKAGEAAIAAGIAADDTEAAAVAAEAAAPGSSNATNARAAADAANTAANLAEAANMAAQAATDSETAIMQQTEAENQRNIAQGEYKTAKAHREAADDARRAALQVQTESDIADAQDSTMTSKMAAAAAHADATKYANMARAEASRAMRARTDHANAKKYADAATAAETAAYKAHMDAATAYNNAAAAETSAEAKAAMKAGTDAADAAEPHPMAAMAAADKASDYADTHLISLLSHANAQDLNLGDEADVDLDLAVARAKKSRIDAVATDIAMEANTAGNGGTATTATASWGADTAAMPDAQTPEEAAPGEFMITLNPAGTELVFNLMAIDADPAMPKTADVLSRGLPGFMHGYQIGIEDAATTHAIVFTDIKQTVAAVPEKTLGEAVSISNKTVTASQIVLPENATDIMMASYDHDGDADTNPLPSATLTCGSAQATDCSYNIVDGELTSLVGYVVSVTGVLETFVLAAVEDEMPDTDYLVFGVWMDEQVTDVNGDVTPPEIAAFADGNADNFTVPDHAHGQGDVHGCRNRRLHRWKQHRLLRG